MTKFNYPAFLFVVVLIVCGSSFIGVYAHEFYHVINSEYDTQDLCVTFGNTDNGSNLNFQTLACVRGGGSEIIAYGISFLITMVLSILGVWAVNLNQ